MPAIRITSPSLRRLLCVVSCIFALAAPAAAKCKVKAIFVQPPSGAPSTAVLVVGAKYFDLELPQRNLSEAVELPAGELVVGVLTQRPVEGEMPKNITKFKIPENWTNCILLFFHDENNKTFPARVIPVNASTANFPLGNTVIFNASEATVAGTFGNRKVLVSPGKSKTVKAPRTGSGSYLVSIDCAYKGDEKPIALCRSTWQHEDEARQILFVTPSPGNKIPRMWGIIDREQPPTEDIPTE
ncbi:MAG: hypothetical protein ACSHX9_10705 [Luteolibacter sp.]